MKNNYVVKILYNETNDTISQKVLAEVNSDIPPQIGDEIHLVRDTRTFRTTRRTLTFDKDECKRVGKIVIEVERIHR